MISIVKPEVVLTDYMGSDLLVVNEARRTRGLPPVDVLDEKGKNLLCRMANEGHWKPFAIPQMIFHLKGVPIFVARQLHTHHIGLVCMERSRRCSRTDVTYFFPTWRNTKFIERCDEIFMDCLDRCDLTYTSLLSLGVPPEQARAALPLSHTTEYTWEGSLWAFINMFKMRIDPHAQDETEEVVMAIRREVEKVFTFSMWAVFPGLKGLEYDKACENM